MSRLLLASALAACTTSPSPAGLSPQIAINSFNNQLRLNIGLQTTTPIDVDASFRGQTLTATTSTQGLDVHGTFALLLFDLDHPVEGEEPVTMHIDGIEVRIGAPPPFDQVQVPPSISRRQPAPITWATTSADPMSWLGGTPCANGSGDIPPYASSVTLAMHALDPADSCPSTVRLYRERTGTLDRAFDDPEHYDHESLRWEQVYDVSFTSTP